MLSSRLGCLMLAMIVTIASATDPTAPAANLSDSKAAGPSGTGPPANSTSKGLQSTDGNGANCICPSPTPTPKPEETEKTPSEEPAKPSADEQPPTSDASTTSIMMSFGQTQQLFIGAGFVAALTSIYF